MIYQIKNEQLTVKIAGLGAELVSVQKNGTEYLWQGDAAFWKNQAINIFPYVARLTEGKYTLEGKTYEMMIHGFAKATEFTANQMAEDHVVFAIEDTPETRAVYPYAFRFAIDYRLEGSKLLITFIVENKSQKTMHFGMGGHPGFNVPLEAGLDFEDYYLEFETVEDVLQVGMSPDCFVTGNDLPFVMADGKTLPLHHGLFDDDAIILTKMSKGVSLRTKKDNKALTVRYPDMDYLGIWHRPHTTAPYVCIEPWTSLPSRKGVVEDLATQPGLIALEAGKTYRNQISFEVE
jgi:galactose mutarotase-like enzyme